MTPICSVLPLSHKFHSFDMTIAHDQQVHEKTFVFPTIVLPDMGVGKAPRVASFHAFALTLILQVTKKYSVVLKASKPTLFSLFFPQ